MDKTKFRLWLPVVRKSHALRLNTFGKTLKQENYPKITMIVVVQKNQILGIAIKTINKSFLFPKDKLNAQFDVISKPFSQRTACVAVLLPS